MNAKMSKAIRRALRATMPEGTPKVRYEHELKKRVVVGFDKDADGKDVPIVFAVHTTKVAEASFRGMYKALKDQVARNGLPA